MFFTGICPSTGEGGGLGYILSRSCPDRFCPVREGLGHLVRVFIDLLSEGSKRRATQWFYLSRECLLDTTGKNKPAGRELLLK